MRDVPSPVPPEELLAHAGWVRRLARALVRPDGVDDAVQDTWVAALGARTETVDTRSWLGGVLRNVVRQGRRSERRRAARERRTDGGDGRDPLPQAGDLAESAELAQRAVRAVLDLEEPYRTTLLLRYLEELTAEAIAARQGVPGSTVRNRLRRGLARVRERLDREHGGRSAWCALLAPLARPPLGAAPVPLPETLTNSASTASTATATTPTTTGGSAVTLKTLIILALIPVGIGAVYLAVNVGTGPDGPANAALASTPMEAPEAGSPARTPVPDTPARTPAVGAATEDVPAVRGRVLDSNGQPVAGALVFVGGQPSPFDGANAAMVVAGGRDLRADGEWAEEFRERGVVRGRHFPTDDDGRYVVRVPGGTGRVFVGLVATPGIHKDPRECQWTPIPGSVDLHATRVPTGELVLSVIDRSTDEPLSNFRGTIAREDQEPMRFEGTDGRFERIFELEGGAVALTIALTDPPWARSEREVLLTPGAREELELAVDSGPGVRGLVTDQVGAPLEGALVFWGEGGRMRRRGSLFQAYQPKSVVDGVWTGSDGRFTLPGEATLATVWHAEHSPATVSSDGLMQVSLAPRGALQGRLVEADGSPVANVTLRLDGMKEGSTDADGRWHFTDLEAGSHGISLGERRFFGVHVRPGETFDAGDVGILDVSAPVVARGEPYLEEFQGLGVGLDRVYRVIEFGITDGRFERKRFLPGRYVLIGRGKLAIADLTRPDGLVDLGDGTLTVHAPPGSHVFVIPEAENDAVLHYGKGMSIEVDEEGQALWDPLPRGRYRVGIESRGVLATVEVEGPGASVRLD